MFSIIQPLSDDVTMYLPFNEASLKCETVRSMEPFLRQMVVNLQSIRHQPFPCSIQCGAGSDKSHYHYNKAYNVGIIVLQEYTDPRNLVNLLAHELCHYTMDNHVAFRDDNGVKLSSYEEAFAETFSRAQLWSALQWARQESYEVVRDLMASFLAEIDRYTHLPYQDLTQQGIEAIPLIDNSLQPICRNCTAVARLLYPYFQARPELWMMLPHVADVHPLAPWSEFFGHMIKTANDSYKQPLIDMVNKLGVSVG